MLGSRDACLDFPWDLASMADFPHLLPSIQSLTTLGSGYAATGYSPRWVVPEIPELRLRWSRRVVKSSSFTTRANHPLLKSEGRASPLPRSVWQQCPGCTGRVWSTLLLMYNKPFTPQPLFPRSHHYFLFQSLIQ